MVEVQKPHLAPLACWQGREPFEAVDDQRMRDVRHAPLWDLAVGEARTVQERRINGGDDRFDLVLSDMAPNLSGMDSIDQPKSMYLAELALDLAQQYLNPGGALVVKLFQGAGFDDLITAMRRSFNTVRLRKPDASFRRRICLQGRIGNPLCPRFTAFTDNFR